MIKKLIYNYSVYVIYFLGVGMVSSGIVLLPFNTVRYSIILTIGLILFTLSSIFNEIIINKNLLTIKESIYFIFTSLALAIGIGMISGGIAHFKESPNYASYLIPLGVIVSCFSYSIKEKYKMNIKQKGLLLLSLLIFSTILHTSIVVTANKFMQNTPAGGDVFGHSPSNSKTNSNPNPSMGEH